MKKLLIGLFSLLTLFSTNTYAQDFLGFRQSNYSGINGVDLNPATLADNRFIVDVVIGGVSTTNYNNHLYFNPHQMPYWWTQTFNNEDPIVNAWLNDTLPDGRSEFIIIPADSAAYYTGLGQGNIFTFDNPKNKPRTAFSSTTVEVLNFMFSFNREHEMGIGVQVKNRTMLNLDHLAPELLTLAQNSLDYPDLWNLNLNDQLLNLSFNSWMGVQCWFRNEGVRQWRALYESRR